MDPIKLIFNADHDLLLKAGIDPSTSEGKAKIQEIILLGLQEFRAYAESGEEFAVCTALLSEG